ncbi:MAG: hypothetical protein WCK18_00975 [Prolixibacteraceae bacterium]|jgi:hypothetical protein
MKKLALVLTFVFGVAMIAPAFAADPVKKVDQKECAKTCAKEGKSCCAAGEKAACAKSETTAKSAPTTVSKTEAKAPVKK